MTLPPGSRLGTYEIAGAIGSGGMGEVYRGRDATLNRDVAIKVLPAALATDTERLARFKREAQVLASLNHPNIAHVYGFEAATLPDGSTAHFLAMEMVEGEDLAERLKRGAIPVDDSTAIAKQIAEGLEEAHERGIIHRDLKPANVKVTPDGKVKILDFGLAKAMEGDPSTSAGNSQLSNSPTMSRHMTEAGMIMGTAAYMSPEQARGKPVDRRTDIWAFGVVLFEVLSGTRLFAGETVSDTLAAVLMREIEWARLPANTPPAVERLLRRCLERDPRLRLRDIGEARIQLSGPLSPDTSAPTASGEAPRPANRRAGLLSAAALLLIVVASGTWWLARRGIATLGDLAIEPEITAVTMDAGLTTEPAVSPNGALLAYASDRGSDVLNVWVQPLPSGQPVQVTHDEAGAHSPSFSPDGSRIVYRSERDGGGLYVVPALGGPERLIAAKGRAPRFSPDGRRIAYFTGGRGSSVEIWVYSEESGTSAKVTTIATQSSAPIWSPDGQALCLFMPPSSPGTGTTADWYRLDLASGVASSLDARTVLSAAGLGRLGMPDLWLKDQMIFANTAGDSTDLWSVGLSEDGRKVTGPVRRLTASGGVNIAPTVASSPGGRQVYFASLDRRVNLYQLKVAVNEGRAVGDLHPLTETASIDTWPSLSRDGRTLLFSSGTASSPDVWRMRMDTHVREPIGAGRNKPTISPDGERAISGIGVVGKWIWSIRPLAGGAAEVPKPDLGRHLWAWPRPSLVFAAGTGEDARKLFAFDLETGKRRPVLAGDGSAGFYSHGDLSPDGHWMSAAEWTSAGRARVIVFPFGDSPAPQSEWIVVSDEDSVAEENGWSPNGQLLYFVSERDGNRCLWVRRLDPRTKRPIGPPTAVQHLHGSRRSMISSEATPARFAMGADSIIFSVSLERGNIWRATLREPRP